MHKTFKYPHTEATHENKWRLTYTNCTNTLEKVYGSDLSFSSSRMKHPENKGSGDMERKVRWNARNENTYGDGEEKEKQQKAARREGASTTGGDAETVIDWVAWRDYSPGEKPRKNIPTLTQRALCLWDGQRKLSHRTQKMTAILTFTDPIWSLENLGDWDVWELKESFLRQIKWAFLSSSQFFIDSSSLFSFSRLHVLITALHHLWA